MSFRIVYDSPDLIASSARGAGNFSTGLTNFQSGMDLARLRQQQQQLAQQQRQADIANALEEQRLGFARDQAEQDRDMKERAFEIQKAQFDAQWGEANPALGVKEGVLRAKANAELAAQAKAQAERDAVLAKIKGQQIGQAAMGAMGVPASMSDRLQGLSDYERSVIGLPVRAPLGPEQQQAMQQQQAAMQQQQQLHQMQIEAMKRQQAAQAAVAAGAAGAQSQQQAGAQLAAPLQQSPLGKSMLGSAVVAPIQSMANEMRAAMPVDLATWMAAGYSAESYYAAQNQLRADERIRIEDERIRMEQSRLDQAGQRGQTNMETQQAIALMDNMQREVTQLQGNLLDSRMKYVTARAKAATESMGLLDKPEEKRQAEEAARKAAEAEFDNAPQVQEAVTRLRERMAALAQIEAIVRGRLPGAQPTTRLSPGAQAAADARRSVNAAYGQQPPVTRPQQVGGVSYDELQRLAHLRNQAGDFPPYVLSQVLAASAPTINSVEEYNRLPKGVLFRDGTAGNTLKRKD